MSPALAQFLATLAQHGRAHDQATTTHLDKLLNITPDTGPFLALLVQATGARAVLEVGTSNGYSTVWLADAVRAQPDGHVTTLEASAAKAHLAADTFTQAGVSACVTLVQTEAGAWLAQSRAVFDFLFLDADRAQYVAWWPQLLERLAPGGLLVVDNATSHAAELAAFTELVAATPIVAHVLVPLGKGELLVWKARRALSQGAPGE
ncbi:MAG: O-methyltransferase [Janthinobacterium lividum]